MGTKIAYTGCHFPQGIQDEIARYFNEKGYAVEIIRPKSRDAWDSRDMLLGYEAIICSGEAYRKETISFLSPTLRILSRHGIGTDEIHKEAATELGIAVCNAAGTLSYCVAECALSLILNTLHGYNAADRDVRDGLWNKNSAFTRELRGMTVGLIGFGGIAQQLAVLLSAFNCTVLAADPFFDTQAAERLSVERADIARIREECDVISVHVPLTDETRGMIDTNFLLGMKRGAIIINTSRGGVIVERDLVEALNTGVIAGVGLDVFEQEPVDGKNPLLRIRNTMLLPHIAAHTYDSQLEAGLMACRNAVAIMEGGEPESLLNPEYRNNIRKGADNL